MGAKASSYLQIPNDEFSQGGAGTGNTTDWPTLAQELVTCTVRKCTSVCVWQREGSQS